MKRILGALSRSLRRNNNYLNKAVKHVEKIGEGKVNVAAPRYPSEKKYQDAGNVQQKEEIQKELETKDEKLIENMNKISIRSDEPVERHISSKPLPTRETEWMHRNDPMWEYGFYEPPEEKIPKGKLMFREALEVMRARLELEGSPGFQRPQKTEAKKILEEHPAVNRVEQEKLDRMWLYFRPFERRDEQKVVRLSELSALQEAMHGYSDEATLIGGFRKNFRHLLEQNFAAKESFEKQEEKEQQLFLEAVKEQRESERKRLTERLAEMKTMDPGLWTLDQVQENTTEKPPSDKRDEKAELLKQSSTATNASSSSSSSSSSSRSGDT